MKRVERKWFKPLEGTLNKREESLELRKSVISENNSILGDDYQQNVQLTRSMISKQSTISKQNLSKSQK